ncbi:proprotein convertase P-domain-containing protein, partial [Aureitalea sp. L0-47]|uniref:proprotein convertase P-domain-containing protein n=1 Tax=Aureitalea sp. L0-47 TaxID=2816962 RepID=UPI0022375C2F
MKRITLLLMAMFISGLAFAQPANDTCANAIAITGDGVIPGTTVGAATEAVPFCGTSSTSPGVYYTFVDGSGTGSMVTINTCNGNTFYDSKISVYTGSCGAFTCVTGNDDTCGLQSQVSFMTDGSSTYYVLVHGFGGQNGPFELTVSGLPPQVDPNAPIIMCPADIMINTSPGECTGVPNFSDAVAIDPGGGSVTVVQTMGPASGTPFPLGDTIVEFTATNDDAPNESTSCQFTVTVVDNQAPSLTCPADITVDNDMGVCGANVTVPQPTIMDNCAGGAPVSGDTGQVALNHNVAGLIDTPVTLTGMTSTTDAMVTINITHQGDFGSASSECFDLEGPDGSQVFFECGTSQCAVINRSFDVDQATWNGWISTFGPDLTFVLQENAAVDDNLCGGAFPDGFYQLTTNYSGVGIAMGATLTNDFNGTDDASDFYPVGTTTVTWTYTDQGGNMASCTMDIIVNDVEAPTVSCVGSAGTVAGSAGDTTVVPIPDNDPAGVSTTITVPESGTLQDMNVDLDIEHTWVGDLIVTLESPAGTSITLIDRMGYTGTGFGCSNNDLLVTLDDEATLPIEDECTGSPITGSFTPNEALSAFDGEDVNGDWILTVSDNAGGDTGMLNAWTLNYDYDGVGVPLDIVLDANGMASVPATMLVTGFNDNCGPGGVTITGGTGAPTPFSLPTTLAGGNGNFGNMFDINALNDVTIQSFDIHGDTGATFDVEVYAKSGTWVGSEDNPAAWTLIGTAPGVVSNGDGVETPLNLTLGYTIPAGETHAFYVTPTDFSTGGFNYTNGTATGNVFASDANIEFLEGAGKGYPFSGTTF